MGLKLPATLLEDEKGWRHSWEVKRLAAHLRGKEDWRHPREARKTGGTLGRQGRLATPSRGKEDWWYSWLASDAKDFTLLILFQREREIEHNPQATQNLCTPPKIHIPTHSMHLILATKSRKNILEKFLFGWHILFCFGMQAENQQKRCAHCVLLSKPV